MAPVITRANLQQQQGAGPTPLSAQIALVSGGKVHVLGSSGPAGCHVETWSDVCVNRATGGQTIAGLLNALAGTANPAGGSFMPGLREARAVALVAVEVNDAVDPAVNWTTYQDQLARLYAWLTGPLVVVNIWNTTNASQKAAVAQANAISAALLANRANCQIVDINALICDANGAPKPGMLIDTEHLAAPGAAILRAAMQEAFGKL